MKEINDISNISNTVSSSPRQKHCKRYDVTYYNYLFHLMSCLGHIRMWLQKEKLYGMFCRYLVVAYSTGHALFSILIMLSASKGSYFRERSSMDEGRAFIEYNANDCQYNGNMLQQGNDFMKCSLIYSQGCSSQRVSVYITLLCLVLV